MNNKIYNLDREMKRFPELNIPIYRFIPFKKLIHMLSTNEISFVKTTLWQDVYENFLLKSLNQPESYYNIVERTTTAFYGQCWTLHRETDALWRIYSTDLLGVKIKTDIARLMKILNGDTSISYLRIGRVHYYPKNKIYEMYSKIQPMDLFGDFSEQVLNSLFVKRKEFQHEKEIRIIIGKPITDKNSKQNILKYESKPNEFIDSIIFDPRLPYQDFKTYKEIVKKFNFKKSILKSKLYSFEKLPIFKAIA